jgi:hypothetical protein
VLPQNPAELSSSQQTPGELNHHTAADIFCSFLIGSHTTPYMNVLMQLPMVMLGYISKSTDGVVN